VEVQDQSETANRLALLVVKKKEDTSVVALLAAAMTIIK
jgi:hypothetical protein